MFVRIVTAVTTLLSAAILLPEAASAQQRPDLVVVIAVDQLRGEYLDRYASQLSGGLGLIRKQSVYFPNGLQNHALTETAPGHASMLSGRYPAHTGIFSNEHGVPDRLAPLVGAPPNNTAGASPERFTGTELYDWMLAADSGARVLAFSRKDRAAILMTGKARADVYWWLPATGQFTTSTYYRTTLPAWLGEFNSTLKPGEWAGKVWNLLLPESEYTAVDDNAWEGAGRPRFFPHALPADSTRVMARLERWPWMDSLIAAGALHGVNALQLGKRGTTDLLNVSFSTLDAVGHDFGPDSREVHDHLLRLDRYLAFFLDSLWKIVPRERTVLAFTSDHGVNPFPQARVQNGEQSGTISMSDVTRALTQRYNNRYRVNFDFSVNNSTILADVEALRARGINVDSVASAAAALVAAKPGVERVYTAASLRAAPASDTAATLWKRQVPPGLGWLTLGVAKPGYQFNSGSQADHGTFSAFSRSVPIAFVVPGVAPRTVTRAVETVDIGPTLAALLGIRPTEAVDGKVLPEVRR